jgi:hypothetical protein
MKTPPVAGPGRGSRRPVRVLVPLLVVLSVLVADTFAAVVTVPYKGPRQIQDLEARGVEIIAFTKYGVDVEAEGAALSYLMSRPYAVAIVEPQAPQLGITALDADLGLYHTYAEMLAEMGALVATYPSLVDTMTIGGTYVDSLKVIALKISDNVAVDESEAEILYMGCHHARELMSVEIPLKFAIYLLQNYGSSSTVTSYVDNREIFIIPMVNPEGHVYVQKNHAGSSNNWWRKNRRNNGNGTFGVDLNRNYSYQWGYDNTGSSPTTSSIVYRGPSPFSEPEMQAVRDFVGAHEFTVWLSYHTYGELLLYPWGYIPAFTPDHEVFAALGEELAAGTGYTVGNPATGAIYLTNGGSDDWAYGEIATKNRIFGYTPEMNSLAQGGFGAAETEIQPTFDLLLNMNLKLLEWGDNPYRVVGPYTPAQYAVQTPYGNGVSHVSWTANDPADPNPVVSYEVEGCLDPTATIDACTPSLSGWTNNGFLYTGSGFSGGGYDAGNGDNIAHTLIMSRPFVVDPSTDSLRFNVTYDLETDYDYGYVDVSPDGLNWTPIEGNITTTFNPYGVNRGHGFTGASGGWVSAIFPLTAYFGQEIQLRIAYITDGAINQTGFRIDNIDPLVSCASIITVAAAVADTLYDHVPPSVGTWRYRVRARDAEDHLSHWSNAQDRFVGTLSAADGPRAFRTDIGANYPNPFNPSTQIPFVVGGAVGSRAARVELAVFSVTGARVATLVDDARTPGTYVSRWNGRADAGTPAPSGIYFARLVVDGSPAVVRKLVLLK